MLAFFICVEIHSPVANAIKCIPLYINLLHEIIIAYMVS
jgi:hypothetical protein